MDIRSRIAAETAAVVPFHCIICFEELSLTDRPPVVLPCGHTFLCQPCSLRLKRCMECREPLFYTIPKLKQQSSAMTGSQQSNTSGGRGSSTRAPGGRYSPVAPLTPPHPHYYQGSSPPHPSTFTQVSFPIPKNLVLIAMMEAAQSAERQRRQRSDDDPGEDHGDDETQQVLLEEDLSLNKNQNDEDDGEKEFDLKRILTGVATLSGSCGTFAIKARDGLILHPSIPDSIRQGLVVEANDHDEDTNDNDDSVVSSNFVISQSQESSTPLEISEPLMRLEQGQTVQVVTIVNGYAKLARGMGYVKAQSNELVKVGAPLDRSCQLEGQLEMMTAQYNNLELELNRAKKVQCLLQDQVRCLATLPPNHPIISEAPVIADESSKEQQEVLLGTPTDVTAGIHDEDMMLRQLPVLTTPSRQDDDLDQQDPLVFPFDGLRLPSSALPTYRRSNSNEALHELGFGCNAFLGEGADFFGMTFSENTNPLLHAASSEDRRRYHGGGADDPTSFACASFDTVDFRTGMSCHRGLLQTNRHSPIPRGRGIRYMMSEHRGIVSGSKSSAAAAAARNKAQTQHSRVHHLSSEVSPPR